MKTYSKLIAPIIVLIVLISLQSCGWFQSNQEGNESLINEKDVKIAELEAEISFNREFQVFYDLNGVEELDTYSPEATENSLATIPAFMELSAEIRCRYTQKSFMNTYCPKATKLMKDIAKNIKTFDSEINLSEAGLKGKLTGPQIAVMKTYSNRINALIIVMNYNDKMICMQAKFCAPVYEKMWCDENPSEFVKQEYEECKNIVKNSIPFINNFLKEYIDKFKDSTQDPAVLVELFKKDVEQMEKEVSEEPAETPATSPTPDPKDTTVVS